MKKRTLKYLLVFSLLTLSLTKSLFAKDRFSGFSFEAEAGLAIGSVYENVWNTSRTLNGNTLSFEPTTRLSLLDWQILNSPFYGLAVESLFAKRLVVSLAFKNFVARKVGSMDDYDWTTDDPDLLTHYSYHKFFLDNFTQANFLIGWLFHPDRAQKISLVPQFGFVSQNFLFSGCDGWRMYKSDNWAIFPFEPGKVITYEQSFLAPLVAFKSSFSIGKYFVANADLSAAYIRMLNCIDNHIVKMAYFNDRLQDAWLLNADLSFYYNINELNKVGIKGNASFMPDCYGFTYNSLESTSPDFITIGGSSRILFTYSLVYSMNF